MASSHALHGRAAPQKPTWVQQAALKRRFEGCEELLSLVGSF